MRHSSRRTQHQGERSQHRSKLLSARVTAEMRHPGDTYTDVIIQVIANGEVDPLV